MQVDGSIKTGCFDLTCPGFVQTSNEIALGAAINIESLPADLTYQITIYIYKVRQKIRTIYFFCFIEFDSPEKSLLSDIVEYIWFRILTQTNGGYNTMRRRT